MKKANLFITLTLASALSIGSAFAQKTSDSDKILVGGHAGPEQTLKVSLDPLLPNIVYHVKCAITSPRPIQMQLSIACSSMPFPTCTFVGQKLDNNGTIGENYQAQLQAGTTNYFIASVSTSGPGSYLTFYNLDNVINANVSNCTATPN